MSERLYLPDLWFYDYEVFAYDWIVVFKELSSGEYYVFHNDNEGVKAFMETDPWLCGFNVKHYDRYIHQGVLNDFDPEHLKEVNDFIISGNEGWNYPGFKDTPVRITPQIDLMDDMQKGLSLKAIEAHLGLNIKESEVDFNLDRPLTDEEVEDVIKYCKYDVDTAEMLYDLRKDYLTNKLYLGRAKGLEDRYTLSLTNAKLVAIYLDAKREVERNDERDYKYPGNLLTEYIPADVISFFDRYRDASIPLDEVFGTNLKIMIGDCEVTIGYGGIHGSINNYYFKEEKEVMTK